MTAPAIAYTRVSSKEQGESRLGLEAQRAEIERFAAAEGFEVVSWHTDTLSGALEPDQRPGLSGALRAAKARRAPVLVSKLDRLSRDVEHIAGLMKHRTEIIVTMLGRQADPFVLHLYAALAQKERAFIAKRTSEALQALKKRGVPLGMSRRSKAEGRRMRAASAKSVSGLADERAEALRPHIEFALKGGASLRQAALTLNARRIPSPMGGLWHAPSLLKAARRLGLR